MAGKAQFGSKIGLIAATVGSAVGLGNVWRSLPKLRAMEERRFCCSI